MGKAVILGVLGGRALCTRAHFHSPEIQTLANQGTFTLRETKLPLMLCTPWRGHVIPSPCAVIGCSRVSPHFRPPQSSTPAPCVSLSSSWPWG